MSEEQQQHLSIKHKHIISKIASEMNLPHELVHNVALAYIDSILSIATVQGKISIEKLLSISISISHKYPKNTNNLKNQNPNKPKLITSKPKIKIKFHPTVINNIANFYNKTFSHNNLIASITELSDQLSQELHQLKQPEQDKEQQTKHKNKPTILTLEQLTKL